MSVETNPHNYTNTNLISSQLEFVKNSVRPSDGVAGRRGLGGGIPPRPSEIKRGPPRRPARSSRATQKSFLFLLEEKIRRAQIRKSEENFFSGWRVVASGGGLASLVGVLLKECSNISQKTPPVICTPKSGHGYTFSFVSINH